MSKELISDELMKWVEANNRVLFVWSGKQVPADLQQTVELVQKKTGDKSRVQVEHADRLGMSGHAKSSFDVIVSNALGVDEPLSEALLSTYLTMLRPTGRLVTFARPSASLTTEFKLSGYVNVADRRLDDSTAVCTAEKPNFEVGAASRLKFASKPADEKPKVWQFSAADIQEDDLINTDELLDELDLKKPVLVDKYDCGESKAG